MHEKTKSVVTGQVTIPTHDRRIFGYSYHSLSFMATFQQFTSHKTQSSDMTEVQITVSICQVILFSATKRIRDSSTTAALFYHSRDRELPLPMYLLDLMTHAETRKNSTINLVFSITHAKVLELSTEMGNSVCTRFESGVVCPSFVK